MILTVGTEIKKSVVKRTYEGYDSDQDRYKLYSDCYNGEGGFKNDSTICDTYLDRHVREADQVFMERIKISKYKNIIDEKVIAPITGYLTAVPPSRESYPPFLKNWCNNVTTSNNNIDSFLHEIIPEALVFGFVPVIVDSFVDHNLPRDVQEKRLGKLSFISPRSILDYELDQAGNFRWLKYAVTIENNGPIVGRDSFTRYRYITQDGWFYIDDHNEKGDTLRVIDSGYWEVDFKGRPPIAKLGFLNDRGIISKLAPIMLDIFNRESELRQAERDQGFSILTLPIRDQDEIQDLKIGTKNALGYPYDSSNKPEFITVGDGPLTHYIDQIASNVQLVYDLAGTAAIYGGQAETAATATYRFQTLDRRLGELANSLADFETDVIRLVSAWHQKELDLSVMPEYPKSFDILDLERLGDLVDITKELNLSSDLFEDIIKNYVKSALPNTDLSKFENIIKNGDPDPSNDSA